MRDHWPRAKPAIDLDAPTIDGLIEPLFPGSRIIGVEPVKGGLTNTNLRVRLADREGEILLRFYQRGGELAQKEMELSRMLESAVPIAPFLHFAPENPVTGHAFAVLEWIDAKPLQDLLPELDADALAEIGAALGTALAAIYKFSYEHFGFFDIDLNVIPSIDVGPNGLLDYLRQTLVEGLGGPRLGREFTAQVIAFAEREGSKVETWQRKACLVHGDFNLSNILVRNAGGAWETAAIIDWEFAFSGGPGFDFGALLRPPLDKSEVFIGALEKAYLAAGGEMPEAWQRIAKITDLFSYADTLNHPEAAPAVVEDVKNAIRQTIEE